MVTLVSVLYDVVPARLNICGEPMYIAKCTAIQQLLQGGGAIPTSAHASAANHMQVKVLSRADKAHPALATSILTASCF